MTHVILRSCCNEATCVPVCPVNCIHPTPDEPGYGTTEMLYIDPEACIDCGACVEVCPVDAIAADYDLVGSDERYLDLNALYFANPAVQGYPTTPQPAWRLEWTGENRPLRVAIVGSGPSAWYAAESLATVRGVDVEIHVYEKLPVPWGLVRFGVAPDHASTKKVVKLFARTAARSNVFLHLNVEIGADLTHEDLTLHHHAVLYASGASTDRRLGIPGEDVSGSHPATDFVAWYNGHPAAADATFDLTGPRAVVVGNGNVALDVARILLCDPAVLARTDVATHAVEALEKSGIREVVVLGRRGPAHAAYSTPELLELAALRGVDVVVEPDGFELDESTAAALRAEPWSAAARKVKVAREYAARPGTGADRRIVLRFAGSPVEILGDDRVTGLRIARNDMVVGADGTVRAEPSGLVEELSCGLVLRSIGYRPVPIPGVPYDPAAGTIPHAEGRALSGDGPADGVYVTGWAKRGASGVIGTNRQCAEETVQALLADHAAGLLTPPASTPEEWPMLLAERAPQALTFRDWQGIDAHERAMGAERGQPRTKLVRVDDMVSVARGTRV